MAIKPYDIRPYSIVGYHYATLTITDGKDVIQDIATVEGQDKELVQNTARLFANAARLAAALQAFIQSHDEDRAGLCSDAGIMILPCDCSLCKKAREVLEAING